MGYFWYVWKSKKRNLKGVLHEKIKCMTKIFKNEKEDNYLKRGCNAGWLHFFWHFAIIHNNESKFEEAHHDKE